MFVYHFVDPDLGVEIFFKKERTTEKVCVDFEIRVSDTCAHLYCRWREFHAESVWFYIVFLVIKKNSFYYFSWPALSSFLSSSFELHSHGLESIKKIHTSAIVDVSRVCGGKGFGSSSVLEANHLPRED